MDIIALVGSIAFAVCAVPAAIAAYRTKQETSSLAFLLLWLLGEVCYLAYVPFIGQYKLLLNYGPNTLCLLVILYFNIKTRLK